MDPSLSARTERMFTRDRTMAWVLVFFLWLTIAFVTFKVAAMVQDGGIRLALYISALVLVIFNTASIAAMIRHYRDDRDHIYGLDIRHLDENRARQQQR
jgi:hypothetical protein